MQKVFHPRIFSTKQFYQILDMAVSSFPAMRSAKNKNVLTKEMEKRIMLAVTEVNGCEICSYFHTQEALKMGMKEEEIQFMLSGNLENTPKDEVIAIMFAQHYAETGGTYDEDAWQQVIKTYGQEKAKGILAAIRIIMMGNAYGIAFGAIKNRFRGKKVKNSRLSGEMGILFGTVFFLPFLFIKRLWERVFSGSNKSQTGSLV